MINDALFLPLCEDRHFSSLWSLGWSESIGVATLTWRISIDVRRWWEYHGLVQVVVVDLTWNNTTSVNTRPRGLCTHLGSQSMSILSAIPMWNRKADPKCIDPADPRILPVGDWEMLSTLD